MSIGIKCPKCHYADTQIIDSRPADNATQVRRRRRCYECSYLFTTGEFIEGQDSHFRRSKRAAATLRYALKLLKPLMEYLTDQLTKLEKDMDDDAGTKETPVRAIISHGAIYPLTQSGYLDCPIPADPPQPPH